MWGGEVRQVVSPPFPFPFPSPHLSIPFSFQTNQWEGRSDPVRGEPGKFPGFPLTNTTLSGSLSCFLPAHIPMPLFSASLTWDLGMSLDRGMPCMSDNVKRTKSKLAAAAETLSRSPLLSSSFDVVTAASRSIAADRSFSTLATYTHMSGGRIFYVGGKVGAKPRGWG